MTEVIILANSKKRGNRCIAGIDIETSKWVRPCFGDGDEGIPWRTRQVNSAEPSILDIIEIPLKTTGPNRDIQPENRYLKDGAWNKIGQAKVKDILRYCVRDSILFYNDMDRVPVAGLRSLTVTKKTSLTLIQVKAVFDMGLDITGKKQLRAVFKYGSLKYNLVVTDCEYKNRFKSQSKLKADCIFTVSLGAPFKQDNCCYKLVAGVIEL
jgi:hypothetical protein